MVTSRIWYGNVSKRWFVGFGKVAELRLDLKARQDRPHMAGIAPFINVGSTVASRICTVAFKICTEMGGSKRGSWTWKVADLKTRQARPHEAGVAPF